MQVEYTQEFWDERYRQRPRIWSGKPNRQLVAGVADLPPGRALDVGCGEGADAAWLASRAWNVLGIDVSDVALARARAHAEELDPPVRDRLEWRHVDLLSAPDLPNGLDLVSIQFMHLPDPDRSRIFRSLAALVGVGGTLLIVAHDPSDLHSGIGRPPQPELFYTPQQIAELLDDAWDIRVCESRPRTERTGDGRDVTISDAVLQAVRIR
ncbi:class I SAM-dependent methyltransferase [Arthrobacter sp. NamB2]|uniref:class I SAM-dependent methyltransferase n=1 Tax=Arthrobacter sp. NamB2 TaxID=2576035 RepID=UPI0010C971F9|nr:class I SAM-dependent methyltransferase [Arthrobacter sp. NamB2]TKV29419.1 class I SAM-dependent methyltransferase [Arthrobacter sp. NamB2]